MQKLGNTRKNYLKTFTKRKGGGVGGGRGDEEEGGGGADCGYAFGVKRRRRRRRRRKLCSKVLMLSMSCVHVSLRTFYSLYSRDASRSDGLMV